ncbi:MAG: NosD domain-containing protein [Candidatus Bathyarchaeia archaeon]
MHKRLWQTILTTTLILYTFNRLLYATQTSSTQTIRNLNTGLEYATIQEAINAEETLNGHIIFVPSGTYLEKIVINKSISLLGEAKETTIIDGGNLQNIINITAENAKVTNFTLRNGGFGYSAIKICRASNCNISDNIIQNCYYGIQLYETSQAVIAKNMILNCTYGIHVYNSTLNLITENTVGKGKNGIHLDISNKNTIEKSNISANIWNGIYIYKSNGNTISDNVIFENNARGIRLQNSVNNIISTNIILKNQDGIHFYQSNKNTLFANTILNNSNGMLLVHSNENTIAANTISFNTQYGIRFLNSSSNRIFHNNFINNTLKNVEQPSPTSFKNLWDNGFEGNFWSDHEGQDQDSDGISDVPMVVDERTWLGIHSQDCYPLMATFSSVPIEIEGQTYFVEVVSNLTFTVIQNFAEQPQENKTLTMRIGETDKRGFIRICIPHALVNPPYTITIGNGTLSYMGALRTNGTHTWLYLLYTTREYQTLINIFHTPEIVPPPPPIWTQLTFWEILGLIAVAVTLVGINFRYRRTIKRQKDLIKDYERRLRQESHFAIASELFKKDVEARKQKITKFEEKYGVKLNPRENIEDIIRSVVSKEKEKEQKKT